MSSRPAEASRSARASHVVLRLGGEIRYDVIGGGSVDVVCWPGGTRPLDDLVALAHELVERSDVRVVLIQPRGCEGSTLPLGGHTVADLCGDVAAVLGELGGGAKVLAGHAFGNRIMRMTATLYPELVRGVALFAAGGLFGPTEVFTDSMSIAMDKGREMDERVAAFGRAFFEDGGDPMLWWKPQSRVASMIKNTAYLPTAAWWDGGVAPMLVVQGALDQSAPPANGEALAAVHPDRVELHTIDGAAHTIPIDRPAVCAELLADWMTRLG